MVDIQPFKAIRPKAELVDKVASLPYDVMNRNEAEELVQDNPYSYLRIDRSEVDLPDVEDVYSKEVYQKAAKTLEDFLEKGWLQKETTEKFYIYELTFQGRTQTGLVVAASVKDYEEDRIKKHEFTRYDKEIDRINHMDAADATTSPIFLTYRDEKAIDDLVNNWKQNHEPVYAFESYYETTHRIWVIENDAVNEAIQALFADNVPALYIADGHHRSASAAKISKKRAEEGRLSGKGGYFLSVAFPINQLQIYDYNRLVHTEVPKNFIRRLENDFEVQKVNKKNRRTTEKYVLALYVDKQWYHLKAKEEIISEDLVKSLDASIAQDYIFNKHFGITDPREDDRLEFVGGIKGLDVLEEAVDNGMANFAVALSPTKKEELLGVSDQGKTMPPKSTWFEPKLLSGLFMYDLETKE